MKRVGGLFDALADARNVVRAAWRASRGKRDREAVRQFLGRLDHEVALIVRQLHAGDFTFGAQQRFEIRDPKTRTIHAPPFRDRVVHHAIVAVVGPVLERGAIHDSYACRLGRGQHAALRRLRDWTDRGCYFLKADVSKFYDSIDHDILRLMLARRFRERRLLGLFDRLLACHESAPGKGLPIGALTSQYLGNHYLDPVDHWAKQGCHARRYLRYMDDLVVIGTRQHVESVRAALPAVMDGLALRVTHGGIINSCDLGVPYLGFVVYPDRVRLNRLGRRRLRRCLGDLERGWLRGVVGDAELQRRGESLFAHARFADDIAWRRTVVGFSRVGEVPGPPARGAGRLVERHRRQVPVRQPQQEEPR